MGKKRIIKKGDEGETEEVKNRVVSHSSKKVFTKGVLYIESTYNNTKLTLTDENGNVALWGTAGSSGFKGAKKSTPYAASKVAGLLGEKAKNLGVKEIEIIVKGVGSGRESAIRSFGMSGFDISRIKDKTPIPHNGPRPPKPRRV